MVAKKTASQPEKRVICVIHVSNLPAMVYRMRNAGQRCPDVSRGIVSIASCRRQDRRAACVETAEGIQLVTGGSADPLKSHQRVASHCHPNERIRRESRYCEHE